MLHINCAWEPHVNPDSFKFHTVFNKKIIKILLENPCTWVTTLFTVKCVTNTFISWPEKTKQAKKKQPVGSLFLLSSCCEQGAAGMLRAFPVHFVPLQSSSTQPNVHDSHADRELHEMWLFIWNRFLGNYFLLRFSWKWDFSCTYWQNVAYWPYMGPCTAALFTYRFPHISQFLKENKLIQMWCIKQFNPKLHISDSLWEKIYKFVRFLVSQTECCTLTIHRSHTLIKIHMLNKQTKSNLFKPFFSQQLLWPSCCWDAQDISCWFCAIAIQQQTV